MKIKKHLIILFALAAFGLSSAQAQDDNTSITVTDDEGREEQISVPEAMDTELDSLMALYNAKMYLRPDTSCNMPDINPVYDPEVYKERLSKLPTVIELPYNDIVQKFIDRYTGELRRSVAYMLGAQNFYMPIFEEALDSYDLPLELKYLPVIESALNPMARSRVGAIGLWQFMLPTAKRYGLTINSMVDERRDIVRSSYAAAHYLSDLYKLFGDWNLVIAAYNCGPSKINKAIHRAKGQRDYWKIYPYLPKETRGYVPAFIAANYVMNYYCDHNICPLETELPVKTDTVMVDRDIHFEQIAHVLGIDVDELQDLNPQYRRNIVNGHSSLASLRLPAQLVSTFIDEQDSILAFNPKDYKPKRREVAVNTGSSSSAVSTAATDDGDSQSSYSSKSSRRHYSSSKSRSSRKSKSRNKSSRQRQQHVTVRQGDTLSEIAERNHTSVKKLRQLNGISGSNIRAGKKIRVK